MPIEVVPHRKYLKKIKEPGSVLACASGSCFRGDMKGKCAECGAGIYYRPYNRNAWKKICLKCAGKIGD